MAPETDLRRRRNAKWREAGTVEVGSGHAPDSPEDLRITRRVAMDEKQSAGPPSRITPAPGSSSSSPPRQVAAVSASHGSSPAAPSDSTSQVSWLAPPTSRHRSPSPQRSSRPPCGGAAAGSASRRRPVAERRPEGVENADRSRRSLKRWRARPRSSRPCRAGHSSHHPEPSGGLGSGAPHGTWPRRPCRSCRPACRRRGSGRSGRP